MADDYYVASALDASRQTSSDNQQPAWIAWLARGMLGAAVAVVTVAVLLPNTRLAALREQWQWFSESISWVEQLWPAVDMVHVVMFCSVGVLAALAFPRWRINRLLLAIAVLAVISEFAQLWVPGRTASVAEAALDVAAAAVGLALVALARSLGRQSWVAAVTRTSFLTGVLLLPLQESFVLGLGGQAVMMSDLLFALAIGMRGLALLGGRAPMRWQAIHAAWMAYVIVLGIACLASPEWLASAGKWLGVAYLALLAVLALDLCSEADFARKLVLVWIAAAGVTALFSAIALVGFYLAPDQPWLPALLSHYGSLPPGPYPRVNSLFANANMLCNYLTVAICLLLAAKKLAWVGKRASNLLLVLLSLAALLTLSPGLGGLALALGLWGWWSWRGHSPGLARTSLLGGGFIAIAVLAGMGVNPASPFQAPSVRWLIWQDALRTWQQAPWLGIGLNQEVVGIGYTPSSGEAQWLTDAHNVWLNLAGQAGLFAVLAMAVICVLLLRHRWAPAVLGNDNAGTLHVACAIAFISAFLYQGLAGSFEDARHVWLLMGLLAATAGHTQKLQPTCSP